MSPARATQPRQEPPTTMTTTPPEPTPDGEHRPVEQLTIYDALGEPDPVNTQ